VDAKKRLPQRYRLGDVADIHLGYTFRDRLEFDAGGTVRVVQMRDLRDDQSVEFSGLVRIRGGDFGSLHRLIPGDLVFRSRGENNTAVTVGGGAEAEDVVLAAPLIKIRARSDIVLPLYLRWIINHPESRSYFDTHARGTSVRMVPKETLAALGVPVPDLETQRRITEFAALADREISLLRELADLKKDYYARAVGASLFH